MQAISLESGEVLWTKKYEELDQGPNGIVVQEGKVFGATASKAFALDQETGKEIWSTKLIRSGREGIDMAPGYHDGLVYVSTVPTIANSEYPAGGVGVLWALDAKTGKKAWHFNTVPNSLWGNPELNAGGGLWYAPSFDEQRSGNPKLNAGGGLWYAPSFDEKGSMYFGPATPCPIRGPPSSPGAPAALAPTSTPTRWSSSTPRPASCSGTTSRPPTTSSTGTSRTRRSWSAPVAGSWRSAPASRVSSSPSTPKPASRSGNDRSATHNGHDEDGLYAMRGEDSKLQSKMVVSPGTLGGVISPMAANKTTLFVPVVNHAVEFSANGETGENSPLTGEMVAIDIETGKIDWNQEYEAAAFGPPTAVNDMVFFTTFDGTVHGLDAKTGGEVWQGSLPAASNTGVMVSGDTLVVPAGLPVAEGQKPAIVAYRLSGK